MYFIGGFIFGTCLLLLGERFADTISWWLECRRWHRSGAGQVHFHWSDLEAAHEAGRQAVQAKMGLDQIVQHCNQVINEAREAKHGRT